MRAVAIRLQGPIQSWGGPTAGDDRYSLDQPTKSGVIGLLAAALGWSRAMTQERAQLGAALAMVVRVDHPGERGIDYHTTQEVPQVGTRKLKGDAVVSRRGYLYDASFVALLIQRDSNPVPLEELIRALKRPRYLLYLGRKSCPPAEPVLAYPDVISDTGYADMLRRIPRLPSTATVGAANDLYVESVLAPEADQRRIRVRDVPTQAPRFFAERVVHIVAYDVSSSSEGRDTVTPWLG